MSYSTAWYDISGLTDTDAAKLIHEKSIDVLLDLSGHTALNRLALFAYRPAPIQASWIGYFASTGLHEIDYFIGDKFSAPSEIYNQFSEKIALLSQNYLCFAPPRFDVKIAPTAALSNNYITFGCFNNANKVNAHVIEVWSEILKKIPDSIMMFKGRHYSGDKKNIILEWFLKNKIQSCRVVFEGPSSRLELLKSYNKLDIALDPFPWMGGATTCEALWMGIPTVTKKGTTFLSNIGQSIAMYSEHPDLCAENTRDYVSKAVALASDIKKLNKAKLQRRDKILKSPLFDGKLFAHNFENLMKDIAKSSLTK